MMEANGYYDPMIHGCNAMQASLIDSPNQYATYNINGDSNDHENDKLAAAFTLDDDLSLHHHHNLLQQEDDDAVPQIGLDHLHGHLLLDNIEQELQRHMMHVQDPSTMEWNQNYDDATAAAAISYPIQPPYGTPPPELLNILQLPCTAAPAMFPPPAASISFVPPNLPQAPLSFDIYADPAPAMSFPPHPPPPPAPQCGLLKDLFGSLPQNYGVWVDERETMAGGVFQEMDAMHFDGNISGVTYNRREMAGKGEGKTNFATERQRREQLNEKFRALRLLIPNPTKADRASIVGDAIEYIKELLRTVEEMKILVEKKRRERERRKIMKVGDDEEVAADTESSSLRPPNKGELDQYPLSGALRSSWLQRRSKESLVDVRIVDDDVNVKLTTKKKPNCLLCAAKALEELRLDVVHVAGGNIGVHHVFLFNTKICEGSSIYAGAIAKKLLEVVDGQCTSTAYPVAF
ncbi:hypothetical protein Cni_G07765 [Canna indica]|uniref:BHLH domain-containing protein n=1 Tax=Canna indica TaxID=4628 RepID=A0AAQ3Q648_9LILI|nr:hypothetical protein Cni_G07765 [Canna indica]